MSCRSLLLLFVAVLAAACGQDPPRIVHFGGPTMGSTYEVKFPAGVPEERVRAVVEAELATYDLAFSQWRDDSEIARCNRHTSTEPFRASPVFLQVLQQALDVAAATEGAFDPTVQPLSLLYRAAKNDPERGFDEAAAANELRRIGFHKVVVKDGAVHKLQADVALDLDGIVAGACVDAIAVRLAAVGVHSFYLQVTGEVLCRGEKAPGVPWIIGVVDPVADSQGDEDAVRELPLRDRALCTSGDYRNAIVANGRVRHHVFDPRTGRSADHGVVSVSVLAPSAALADALGTAFLVLGDEEVTRLWPALRAKYDLGALFLVAAADGSLREIEKEWPR